MVIVRSARPRPMKLTAQWKTVVTRFLKPVRKARWTKSQSIQAGSPATLMGPSSATA